MRSLFGSQGCAKRTAVAAAAINGLREYAATWGERAFSAASRRQRQLGLRGRTVTYLDLPQSERRSNVVRVT
jgi:hypothetical protein